METTTKSDLQLTVRKLIPAKRDKVFAAWTDVEHLKNWWGKPGWATRVAEVDLRIGGKYRLGMQPPEGEQVYVCTGTFKEIRKPSRVVYSWAWEQGTETTPETLVTVEFIDKGDQTELVLHHTGFTDGEATTMHTEGWNAVLESFVQYSSK